MAIIDKPTDHFTPTIWAGNNSSTGATRSLTTGFQPDLVWSKNRSNSYSHNIFDSVRGSGTSKCLQPNNTSEESGNTSGTVEYGYVSAFNTDGFTVTNGTSASYAGIWSNQSGQTFASWNWKAGGTAVSNTAGSITSSVSVNTDSGFSIGTYTGNGTAGATVGHGLTGMTPSMIIIKNRNDPTAHSWAVYHSAIGATGALQLNATDAVITSSVWFNNTAPTSSVFSIGGSGSGTNSSGYDRVFYAFANTSMIKCGKYTGNGSTDGTFVYTGFKPAFLLIKSSSTAGTTWFMFDNKRASYNVVNKELYAEDAQVEATVDRLDFCSNGFKCRNTSSSLNGSGNTYIYLAIAEQSFVTSTTNGSIPATAR